MSQIDGDDIGEIDYCEVLDAEKDDE